MYIPQNDTPVVIIPSVTPPSVDASIWTTCYRPDLRVDQTFRLHDLDAYLIHLDRLNHLATGLRGRLNVTVSPSGYFIFVDRNASSTIKLSGDQYFIHECERDDCVDWLTLNDPKALHECISNIMAHRRLIPKPRSG